MRSLPQIGGDRWRYGNRGVQHVAPNEGACERHQHARQPRRCRARDIMKRPDSRADKPATAESRCQLQRHGWGPRRVQVNDVVLARGDAVQ